MLRPLCCCLSRLYLSTTCHAVAETPGTLERPQYTRERSEGVQPIPRRPAPARRRNDPENTCRGSASARPAGGSIVRPKYSQKRRAQQFFLWAQPFASAFRFVAARRHCLKIG